jgi:hypothetical protein
VAVIPATLSGADHDQVWFVVKRTIDGAIYRSVEFLKKDFPVSGNKTNAWFVDCATTTTGSGLATVTLAHLANERVQILADGASQGFRTANGSGVVVIDPPADVVQCGLAFESNLYTFNFEIPQREQASTGTSQGKRIRMPRLWVRFNSTIGGQIGPGPDNLEDIPFREQTDLVDNAPPLFTGDKEIETEDDWDTESRIYLRQVLPLPQTVLAFMPEFEVNE